MGAEPRITPGILRLCMRNGTGSLSRLARSPFSLGTPCGNLLKIPEGAIAPWALSRIG